MDKIAKLSNTERFQLFQNTSEKFNIPIAMVEKDFWVSWVLWKLFNDFELKEILRFKGGTSLSKGYSIIDRFSEDLDIILSKEIVIGNEELFKSSNKKQSKFTEELSLRSADYISTTLKTKIEKILANIVKIYTDEEYVKINSNYKPKIIDNKSLHIIYPKSTNDTYLRPDILLEIGIMSAWTPNELKEILPYIANEELVVTPALVPTIKAKRTFWDKVTILHREYYRPENSHTPTRYSRHYYDLYQLGHSYVKDDALDDFELLAEVVERKDKLYHCAWAKYEDVLNGNLHLLPNDNNQDLLVKDYKAMQGMIFGDIPKWDQILDFLQKLEDEINKKAKKLQIK